VIGHFEKEMAATFRKNNYEFLIKDVLRVLTGWEVPLRPAETRVSDGESKAHLGPTNTQTGE